MSLITLLWSGHECQRAAWGHKFVRILPVSAQNSSFPSLLVQVSFNICWVVITDNSWTSKLVYNFTLSCEWDLKEVDECCWIHYSYMRMHFCVSFTAPLGSPATSVSVPTKSVATWLSLTPCSSVTSVKYGFQPSFLKLRMKLAEVELAFETDFWAFCRVSVHCLVYV